MKKSQAHLLKLASKFGAKYGQSQNLQQIIEAAASHGANSANGIMNFPAQLKQDNAALTISITIDAGMMGGRKVTVSSPSVNPPQFATNYTKLPEQIKNYLDRNIEYFPQVPNGTTTLEYPLKGDEVASY
jgi:hypothetical protein